MKKVGLHIGKVLVLLFGLQLASCSAAEEKKQVDKNKVLDPNNLDVDQNLPDNKLLFEGNLIELEKEGAPEQQFTVPIITKTKEDIHFRAKRIPTALYLQNQGLEEEELTNALEETKTEQLFYFEFEETLKQDLVKKYLEENLDRNIAYLSFEVYNDFQLITSKGDTIEATYSLYERNFHVAPFERVLVSFTGVNQDEKVKLLYSDKLFKKGEMDFIFAPITYLENNIKNPS